MATKRKPAPPAPIPGLDPGFTNLRLGEAPPMTMAQQPSNLAGGGDMPPWLQQAFAQLLGPQSTQMAMPDFGALLQQPGRHLGVGGGEITQENPQGYAGGDPFTNGYFQNTAAQLTPEARQMGQGNSAMTQWARQGQVGGVNPEGLNALMAPGAQYGPMSTTAQQRGVNPWANVGTLLGRQEVDMAGNSVLPPPNPWDVANAQAAGRRAAAQRYVSGRPMTPY